MREETLYFATRNKGKFAEVVEILTGFPMAVEQMEAKGREIQSDLIEEIAAESVRETWANTGRPVFVEDAGLFIEHLRWFPGPYTAYVYRTIGVNGILTLMEGVVDRDAHFRSVVAFQYGDSRAVTFLGDAHGRISTSARGGGGFGYDPIFEPLGGNGRTFAEMNVAEKNEFSHRAMAVKKFAEWYLSRGDRGSKI